MARFKCFVFIEFVLVLMVRRHDEKPRNFPSELPMQFASPSERTDIDFNKNELDKLAP